MYMPHNCHWPARFELIPLPLKVGSSAAKYSKFPRRAKPKNAATYPKSDIEDTCMQSDIANPNRYDVNVLLSTLV